MGTSKNFSIIDKLQAFIVLTRPVNCLMVAFSVLVTIYISTGTFGILKITLPAIFAVCFIVAGGNAINDFFDVEIDKINKPKRPLPAGILKPKSAAWFSVFLFLIGFGSVSFLSAIPMLIVALNTILLIWYAFKLKKSGFAGNLIVSYLVSSVFIFSAAAVGHVLLGLFISSTAFFTTLAREIFKDLEDIKGDALLGANTLPAKKGLKRAVNIASFFLVLAILISPLPYLFGILSIYYLLTVIITDVIFFIVLFSMFNQPTILNAAINQKKIKFGAFIGLLAFLIGTIG